MYKNVNFPLRNRFGMIYLNFIVVTKVMLSDLFRILVLISLQNVTNNNNIDKTVLDYKHLAYASFFFRCGSEYNLQKSFDS